jgi:hypothetical protein
VWNSTSAENVTPSAFSASQRFAAKSAHRADHAANSPKSASTMPGAMRRQPRAWASRHASVVANSASSFGTA